MVLISKVISTLRKSKNLHNFNESVHFRTDLFDSKCQSYLLINLINRVWFVLVVYWLNRIVFSDEYAELATWTERKREITWSKGI